MRGAQTSLSGEVANLSRAVESQAAELRQMGQLLQASFSLGLALQEQQARTASALATLARPLAAAAERAAPVAAPPVAAGPVVVVVVGRPHPGRAPPRRPLRAAQAVGGTRALQRKQERRKRRSVVAVARRHQSRRRPPHAGRRRRPTTTRRRRRPPTPARPPPRPAGNGGRVRRLLRPAGGGSALPLRPPLRLPAVRVLSSARAAVVPALPRHDRRRRPRLRDII